MNIIESLRKIENQIFKERDETHDLVGAYLSENVDKNKLWEMLKNNNVDGIINFLEGVDDCEIDETLNEDIPDIEYVEVEDYYSDEPARDYVGKKLYFDVDSVKELIPEATDEEVAIIEKMLDADDATLYRTDDDVIIVSILGDDDIAFRGARDFIEAALYGYEQDPDFYDGIYESLKAKSNKRRINENAFSDLDVNKKKAYIQDIINDAVAKLPGQYRNKVKFKISDDYFKKNDNGCLIYVMTIGVSPDALGTSDSIKNFPDTIFYNVPVDALIKTFQENHWKHNGTNWDKDATGRKIDVKGKPWKEMEATAAVFFFNGGWDTDAINKHNNEESDARTNKSNVMDRQEAQRKQSVRDANRGDMENNRRSAVNGSDMNRQSRERQAGINAANRGNVNYNSTRDSYGESLNEDYKNFTDEDVINSYDHFANDLGKTPSIDDILDEVAWDANPVETSKAYKDIRAILRRNNLEYLDEDLNDEVYHDLSPEDMDYYSNWQHIVSQVDEYLDLKLREIGEEIREIIDISEPYEEDGLTVVDVEYDVWDIDGNNTHRQSTIPVDAEILDKPLNESLNE